MTGETARMKKRNPTIKEPDFDIFSPCEETPQNTLKYPL
jgi:hypothetical protein